MPKRTYWDRSLFKEVREIYKRPRRKAKKELYTSKAYREAQYYHTWRFSPDTGYSSSYIANKVWQSNASVLSRLFSEHFWSEFNRPGFMRTYLAVRDGTPLPTKEQTDTPWYAAYKKEDLGDYNPKKAYTVPPRDQWVKWKEPEAVKNQCNTLS